MTEIQSSEPRRIPTTNRTTSGKRQRPAQMTRILAAGLSTTAVIGLSTMMAWSVANANGATPEAPAPIVVVLPPTAAVPVGQPTITIAAAPPAAPAAVDPNSLAPAPVETPAVVVEAPVQAPTPAVVQVDVPTPVAAGAPIPAPSNNSNGGGNSNGSSSQSG